jgi:hypothetical protein
MPAPRFVTFVERSGPDADARLATLSARLRSEGTAVRLLRSRQQADLALLVVEGDPPLATDDVAGARVWRFEEAAS